MLTFRQMISGYFHPIYDKILPDWRRIDYQTMTRGGPRTESLWLNFKPTSPHWHTYAGSNSTERVRIRRKAARWAKQLVEMPEAEQLAVIQAILLAADNDASDTEAGRGDKSGTDHRQPLTHSTPLKDLSA